MIESNRSGYVGKFIDAHHSMSARVTTCARSERVDNVWGKWILHHIKDDIICFESVRYRDHYLDMNHSKSEGDRHVQKITRWADIPKDASWAQFKVWGSALDNVAFQSRR